MCGIVGSLGSFNAKDVVLKGLERLEYRGYDSAGLAMLHNEKITVFKDIGRVQNLINITPDIESHIGIGHTRWATHGKVTQDNSHPHYSMKERFILVHNGIIENARELKESRLSNCNFRTETDSEVIAYLIEYYFEKYGDVSDAIRKTMSLLDGSYALVIIDTENSNKLYVAKNKSPLLIGVSDEGFIVGSDIMPLLDHCKKFIPLEDGSFVELDMDKNINIYDVIGKKRDYELHDIVVNSSDIGKGNYEHYMLKEIDEQASVIRRLISEYFNDNEVILDKNIVETFEQCERIYILAAGSSAHAGHLAKGYFEQLAGIPTEVHISSEFVYNTPVISKNPLFIFISQSGETADSRACLVKIKEMGYPSLAITNVSTSTMARESDAYLDIFAGPEIAVASTKAYVASLATLLILAYRFGKPEFNLKQELSKAAGIMDDLINKKEVINKLSSEMLKKRNAFFIGRGLDYYIAMEAALKLKEISYIQAEGFAAGELKHGTIALIEEGTPVAAIITNKNVNLNTRSNLMEVESRGANTMVISMKSFSLDTDQIVIEDLHPLVAPMAVIIPCQLLAYYGAILRGSDVDKPRNLAKSVTVE